MNSCPLPFWYLRAPSVASNLNLFSFLWAFIFPQKSILIELLNQASFSSLKLLPFDNILIVTKASMQKIRNALPAHLPSSSSPTQHVGIVGWNPGLLREAGNGFRKEKSSYSHYTILAIHLLFLFLLYLFFLLYHK